MARAVFVSEGFGRAEESDLQFADFGRKDSGRGNLDAARDFVAPEGRSLHSALRRHRTGKSKSARALLCQSR